MSHEHSVLELAEGLTVLIGPNNCGKSAIVTALQTVCQYDSSKFMLRHGERECVVRIETAAGDQIEWSRTKSGSPMYKINGEQFDRLNRTVPKQLHDVLRMPLVDCDDQIDVHFGEQKSPTFLLNDKPTAAAQFFASTSDTSRLFAMQRLHRQRVNENKKEQKRLISDRKQLSSSIEILEPLDEIRDEIAASEQVYQRLVDQEQQIVTLQQTIQLLKDTQQEHARLTTANQLLGSLNAPPELQPTETISGTIQQIEKLENEIALDNGIGQILELLAEPPRMHPISELEFLTHSISKLQIGRSELSLRSDAIADLEPIPEFVSEDQLQSCIDSVEKLEANIEHANAKAQILESMVPPPIPQSDDELAAIIDQLTRCETEVAERLDKQYQVADLSRNLNLKIDAWLEQNPTCPTCGQPSTREPWEHSEGHDLAHNVADQENPHG